MGWWLLGRGSLGSSLPTIRYLLAWSATDARAGAQGARTVSTHNTFLSRRARIQGRAHIGTRSHDRRPHPCHMRLKAGDECGLAPWPCEDQNSACGRHARVREECRPAQDRGRVQRTSTYRARSRPRIQRKSVCPYCQTRGHSPTLYTYGPRR
ncbi:hypothetical protein BD413DRAFT_123567 [Trametes elegans]|nr:hypothetical protein BD413DRAFT_123567 [Trametes elegans]